MKTIRNMTILAGLSAVLFALVATGAKAQVLSKPSFTGTFTLPAQAQWGTMTLPAGEYSLQYGSLSKGGPYLVTIAGKAEASPRGMILVAARSDVSATKNALNCIREADMLLVRALELPAIGESVHFLLPRGAKLVAHKQIHNGYTQLAEAPMLIQRVPIKANGK